MRIPAAPTFLRLLALLGLVIAAPHAAHGQTVTQSGDVAPTVPQTIRDANPFIGIPEQGNQLFAGPTNFAGQPLNPFTGLPTGFNDEDGTQIGQFNYERNANIEVGRFSSGSLSLTNEAVLRFGDLIIGGVGDINSDAANNLAIEMGLFGQGGIGGTGRVEIIGDGSLFNNHEQIVPTQFQSFQDPETPFFANFIPDSFNASSTTAGAIGIDDPALTGLPGFTSDVINNIRRDGGDAFDLYVGLTSTGTLDLLEGGRAEIRDGAFIGVAPGVVGTVNVDGAGSALSVYGNRSPVSVTGIGSGEETVIGPFGTGVLRITNRGVVESFNRAALGAVNADGEDGDADGPEVGGNGLVLVEGADSQWRVFTSQNVTGAQDEEIALSIGEFFDVGGLTRIDMLFVDAGTELPYSAGSGRGTLTISQGGSVIVAEDQGPAQQPDDNNEAGVRIGRFGVLELSDGRIDIADRLENDGVIRTGAAVNETTVVTEGFGDGVIDTGSFFNSPLGEVHVRGGESLRIRSRNEIGVNGGVEMITAGGVMINYFHANAGLIEVLGDEARGTAEIEFDRDFDPIDSGTINDDRFRNLLLAGVPFGDPGAGATIDIRGQIKARDANLRFRSGLLNDADLEFVGGDNVATGAIENTLTGIISLTNNSHVTFQDNIVNAGAIVLSDGSTTTFASGLTSTGDLTFFDDDTGATIFGETNLLGAINFVIADGATGEENATLNLEGDITFGAGATLGVAANGLSDVMVGDTFDLISVDGPVTDAGLPGLLFSQLPVLPAGLFFITDVDLTDGYTLTVGDLTAFGVPLIGGDFDGDGLVTPADLAIWQMFFGLTAGATAAQGDADGDGDVDIFDLAIINDQLGGPSGAPAAVAAAVVPEPAAGLLVGVGLLVATSRRRGRA